MAPSTVRSETTPSARPPLAEMSLGHRGHPLGVDVGHDDGGAMVGQAEAAHGPDRSCAPGHESHPPGHQIDGPRSIPSSVSLGHVCTPFVEPSASGLLGAAQRRCSYHLHTTARPPGVGVSRAASKMRLLVPG